MAGRNRLRNRLARLEHAVREVAQQDAKQSSHTHVAVAANVGRDGTVHMVSSDESNELRQDTSTATAVADD